MRKHVLVPGPRLELARHRAGFVAASGDAERPADEGKEERGAAAGRLGAPQLHEGFLVAPQRGQRRAEGRLPELRIEVLRPARVLDREEVVARRAWARGESARLPAPPGGTRRRRGSKRPEVLGERAAGFLTHPKR